MKLKFILSYELSHIFEYSLYNYLEVFGFDLSI